MDVWPGCHEPRREPHPPLQTHKLEKDNDPEAGEKRGMPVAGEHRHQCLEHRTRRLRSEKQIAELLGVEADHEAAEDPVAAALSARETTEQLSRQIPDTEAIRQSLRSLE